MEQFRRGRRHGFASVAKRLPVIRFWLILLFSYPVGYFAVANEIDSGTKIYVQKVSSDSLVLRIDNSFPVPVSLRLLFDLKNLKGDGQTELQTVVPPNTQAFRLAGFKRADLYSSYAFNYRWKIVLGDVFKIPDDSYNYRLPFNRGSFPVSQGPGGSFSHRDLYAFDFLMPVGTPVFAARDGVIASVKSDSDRGGADKAFIDDANFISIYHVDGTLAYYFHLKNNGSVVKEGDTVKKGDLIGYSGNTGFTSGAHLHFEIVQPDLYSEKNKTISFKWESEAEVLYSSASKKRLPPGKTKKARI